MGRAAILAVLAAALAGCGGAPGDAGDPATEAVEARPLIAEVQEVGLDPATSTTILSATGVAPVQGYWEGALVPVGTGDPSVLAFAFRAVPPTGPVRASTPRSREIAVALALTEADLAGIREIRVSGAGNGISIRR